MVTFDEFRETLTQPLPLWFNEQFYSEVYKLINKGEKLRACKFIVSESKANGTGWGEIGVPNYNQYGLKWAKEDVADKIEQLKRLKEREVKAYDENLNDYVTHKPIFLSELKEKMNLPDWYGEPLHSIVISNLKAGSMLQAVKAIKDSSNKDLRTCKDLIVEINTIYKSSQSEFEAYNKNMLEFINKPELIEKVYQHTRNNARLLKEALSHIPYPILQSILDKK